jgi:hypothetical protein
MKQPFVSHQRKYYCIKYIYPHSTITAKSNPYRLRALSKLRWEECQQMP